MTKKISEPIRWGIIGCGDVTEQKSGPAFNKVSGSRLQAVMRRNSKLAEDYAKRHSVPRWYDDALALIHDPDVDAIYVATPPDTHASYAIEAMRAGKPVYVEKPMARTHRECLEMIKVSEETGQALFVAYYRRALPGFKKVKQIIDDGVLGNIRFFQIKFMRPPLQADFEELLPWRVDPLISGGGYLHDMGSHQLDIIDYLLEPIADVKALTLNQHGLYKPEDYISAGFITQSGIAGNGVWHFSAPEVLTEDSIEIAGEKGSVKFSCFGFTDTKLTLGGNTQWIENPRPENVQLPLIETIVDELKGINKCPSTPESAARTSKILEMITGC